MFIRNFRESLQYRIQTQNDSGQPLWAPKKYPQKNDRERIFFLQISKLRINRAYFKPVNVIIVLFAELCPQIFFWI